MVSTKNKKNVNASNVSGNCLLQLTIEGKKIWFSKVKIWNHWKSFQVRKPGIHQICINQIKQPFGHICISSASESKLHSRFIVKHKVHLNKSEQQSQAFRKCFFLIIIIRRDRLSKWLRWKKLFLNSRLKCELCKK